MKLGLVKETPYQQLFVPHDDDGEDGDEGTHDTRSAFEQWEDLQDSDEEDERKKAALAVRGGMLQEEDDKEEYIFDTKRRSSVDLDSLSENLHDLISSGDSWDGSNSFDFDNQQQSKRRRSKKPLVDSITEATESADDDEEISADATGCAVIHANAATNNSNDGLQDMELRDIER